MSRGIVRARSLPSHSILVPLGDETGALSDRRPLHHARDALIGADLIAFEHPLYQVLSLDNEAPATPAERTGATPRRLSEVLRQMGTPT